MKIYQYKSDIIIEDTNVHIEEPFIKQFKISDGKYKEEVDSDILDMFCGLLYDIIRHRDEHYDSKYLIEELFSKLSEENKSEILNRLNDYI